MKKTLIIILALFSTLTSFSQISFSVPASAESGQVFTITASGESSSAFVANIPFYWNVPPYTTNPSNQTVVIDNIQQAGYPYSTSGQPSKFSTKITSGSSSPVTVTFNIRYSIGNNNNAPFINNLDKLVTITINPSAPVQSTFYNTAKSGVFVKNNCAVGTAGSSVTYTIPANTPSCTSTISQADADAKAQNLVNSGGQAYANANGQCLTLYYNEAQTGSFVRNNCVGSTQPGPPITATVDAGRFQGFSLIEANNKAIQALNIEGQEKANTLGTCTPITIYKKLVAFNYVVGTDPSVYYATEDYKVEFYSDAAFTQPLAIPSASYSFSFSELKTIITAIRPNGIKTTINHTATVMNGAFSVSLGNFVTSDCPTPNAGDVGSAGACTTREIKLVN